MENRFLFVIAVLVGLSANQVGAATFFSDDFESYALDADVSTSGGWTISHTATTVETEADFHLADTKAAKILIPVVVSDRWHYGPATVGGGTTPTYSLDPLDPGGRYMISTSDGIKPGILPTFLEGTTPADGDLDDPDPAFWNSRINNATYSGAANDIVTPSFSTVAAAGDVWLHASTSAILNDNAESVFDVDVSTDGGSTWVNHFRRISAGTDRNFANGDFDRDLDVDGADFLTQQRLFDYSDCPTCGDATPHDIDRNRRNTDQRWSDWKNSYQGVYTPLVATVGATLGDGNAGGSQGELDLNLGSGLGADVKVRFRHSDSRDGGGIAIDNIKVDEVAPAGSETVTIFSEDFNAMTGTGLGQMDVYNFSYFFGVFGTDSGHGSGTLSGHSWGAQDRPSIDYDDENEATQGPPEIDPLGRYDAGVIRASPEGVNHLGHPTAEGTGLDEGRVPFAIIDPLAEPEDSAATFLSHSSERLHTPLLDLSGHTNIILEWDDEAVRGGIPALGSVASVVLMEDVDFDGPDDGDTIIAAPDKLIDLFNPYLPYDQYAGGLVFGANGASFEHRRIDISALVAMAAGDKTNLYLAWQYVSPQRSDDYWAVDNILITGDGVAPSFAAAVPEPSSLLLAVLGLPVIGARRRRRLIG